MTSLTLINIILPETSLFLLFSLHLCLCCCLFVVVSLPLPLSLTSLILIHIILPMALYSQIFCHRIYMLRISLSLLYASIFVYVFKMFFFSFAHYLSQDVCLLALSNVFELKLCNFSSWWRYPFNTDLSWAMLVTSIPIEGSSSLFSFILWGLYCLERGWYFRQ